MVDLEEDLCGFFSGFVGSKLVAIFADQWKKFGNFVQPCPLAVKHQAYLISVFYRFSFVFVQVLSNHFDQENITRVMWSRFE